MLTTWNVIKTRALAHARSSQRYLRTTAAESVTDSSGQVVAMVMQIENDEENTDPTIGYLTQSKTQIAVIPPL